MEWEPIETAPKDGTRVLLYDRFMREQDFAVFVGRWVMGLHGAGWYATPGAFSKRPTHWMPIPKPPSA